MIYKTLKLTALALELTIVIGLIEGYIGWLPAERCIYLCMAFSLLKWVMGLSSEIYKPKGRTR